MNEYSDEQRVNIAKQEYGKFSKGGEVRIENDTILIGYVVEVINNQQTGEQTYLIAPTKLSANPTKAELAEVENLTVLYRGSTMPFTGVEADWFKDWGLNDIPIAAQILANDFQKITPQQPTGQLKSASETLKTAMKRYPNANFDIYGQSLGSMNGQFAVADTDFPERIHLAYFYEGPNVYSLLNEKQKATSKQLKNRVFNYIDDKDLVPIGYGATGYVGTLVRIYSKKVG